MGFNVIKERKKDTKVEIKKKSRIRIERVLLELTVQDGKKVGR